MQAWSSRLLKCNLRELVETDILSITRMSQFMKRKCTGTYQIYLFQFLRPLRSGEMWNMWFEEIEVRGSHKSHGSFLSQYPPPFLSNMHPKVCIFWWWCLWWGSIHCSAHPGWDKKRDDDGFCFISCFLFKAQARSLFHRDLFILSWCLRLTCSKYRTQVWSLYCLALSLTHSLHNAVSKVQTKLKFDSSCSTACSALG